MASGNSAGCKVGSTNRAVALQRLDRVLRAARVEATDRRQKRTDEHLIRTDEHDEDVAHATLP